MCTGTFIAGLVVSAIASASLKTSEERQRQNEFDLLCQRVQSETLRRLANPLLALSSMRSMYLAHMGIDRLSFRRWVESRDIQRDFPGVRGLGMVRVLRRAELADFLEAERADQAPDFQITTRGDAPDLFVITYVEPLGRNRQAWGLDLGSEPLRREAVERAIRSGETSLSQTITLVQANGKGPGFLFFKPIYREGAATDTPEARRAAIERLVYSPVVARELFAGLSDSVDRLLDIDIYDGVSLPATRCIFDDDGHLTDQEGPFALTRYHDRRLVRTIPIEFGGHAFALVLSGRPALDARHGNLAPQLVFIGGSLISALIGLVAWQLGRGRLRALDLARHMTADLADTNARLANTLRENELLNGVIRQHFIVSIADGDGRIIDVNDAFCAITGYTREELLGRGHQSLNSGVHPLEFWTSLWATLLLGTPWRGDICNRAKDGTLHWVDTIIVPARDEQGGINRFISIRSDITARKRTEAEMAELNRHLERETARAAEMAAQATLASAAKSAFLANMSHEIRTPMNGVLGMTELLLGMGLNPEQEDSARTIYRSAEALLTILNDILDFSKIEAGRLTLERIPFDLHQVVFDVAELFRGRLADSPVELLVHLPAGLPVRYLGDPGRVRQILSNLVGNAVKFTATGHILIDVAVTAGAGGVAGDLLLRVEDTGIGIPLDRQHLLFQPFTQADVSTSRRYGGTGLGLTICRHLAEAMGGEIRLESRPGAGTIFLVHLRLERDPEAVAPATVSQELAGRRILAVDDNPVSGRILAELTEACGGACTVVNDGPAALAALAGEGTFDAVLIDRRMPGMDGPQLAARIRADGLPHQPALLLMDTAGLRGQAGRGDDSGWQGFLAKPSPAPRFAATVAQAIADQHAGKGDPVQRPRTVDSERLPKVAPPAAITGSPRILLAEDNPVNQKVAVMMLRRLGCTVTVANNGRAAVEAVAAGIFDLVLMDCQMPEMDGFEATQQIRLAEAGSGRRLPIIAMTANASAEDQEQCLAAGMDGHLAKPAKLEDLQAVIQRWCPA